MNEVTASILLARMRVYVDELLEVAVSRRTLGDIWVEGYNSGQLAVLNNLKARYLLTGEEADAGEKMRLEMFGHG